MGLLYGRAGRLPAQNGGFRPGQWPRCASAFMRLGGHRAVCSAISASDRQATSAKLQVRGLGVAVLQTLAQHSKCRLSMAQGDTRAMLVDTLKTTTDSSIQLSALRCLAHLTERKDIATMLLQEGGLDECLRLLHAFSDEGSEPEALEKATLTQVRKMPSWPRSWANFSSF